MQEFDFFLNFCYICIKPKIIKKIMNKLDRDYLNLLQDILDNGVEKKDRTCTGTLSVFGRQIRHNMKDGFHYSNKF